MISVIIPIINEEGQLPQLLDNLQKQRGCFEVLFVDGGSSDNSLSMIGESCRILKSPCGRAVQMNFGAKKASGSILFFLHADSLPPSNFCSEIETLIAAGAEAGCFPIKFSSRNPLMALCAAMSNIRARFRKIAFGDQGIFMTRELFERLGGFPHIPLMEDYRMSELIAAETSLVMARKAITTSARRFEKGGVIRTMWLMQKMQYLYRKGTDADILAKIYRQNR